MYLENLWCLFSLDYPKNFVTACVRVDRICSYYLICFCRLANKYKTNANKIWSPSESVNSMHQQVTTVLLNQFPKKNKVSSSTTNSFYQLGYVKIVTIKHNGIHTDLSISLNFFCEDNQQSSAFNGIHSKQNTTFCELKEGK